MTVVVPDSTIAVLLPCYNEAAAISDVVKAFKTALPDAHIYVYDNNSTDDTASVAQAAGATVRRERRQGKGYVVQRMFSEIDADIYVLADGDGTYDASAAPRLVETLRQERADMVTGTRIKKGSNAYRAGHEFGNRLITGAVRLIFGENTADMLSGYRVFSRRFVKSFPAMSKGFETETEFTVHALDLKLPIYDVATDYFDRAEGGESKLSTFKDGFRIMLKIFNLFRHFRPLAMFGVVGAFLLALATGLALPILIEYTQSGLVPRFPTLILVVGLSILSLLSFVCGLILDTVATNHREAKRLFYLQQVQSRF